MGEVKGMDDLFRKSFFSLFRKSNLGFLAGLVLLLTGFIMAICTFPEKIWFLGLVILATGLILTILGGRYYVGIADKETSKPIRKLNKKG